MCASRRLAIWPQLVAISLIGIGAASCSADSGRFDRALARPDRAALAQRCYRLDSAGRAGKPHRQPAAAASGQRRRRVFGRRPRHGLLSARRRSDRLDRASATAAAELDLGRRHADRRRPRAKLWKRSRASTAFRSPRIMQANNISSPAAVHPGQHLVIPRYRSLRRRRRRNAHRVDRAGGSRAGRPPRSALLRSAGHACRGAGRDAQQHRAALRQAGHGHCQGQ